MKSTTITAIINGEIYFFSGDYERKDAGITDEVRVYERWNKDLFNACYVDSDVIGKVIEQLRNI